jgi:hypothetical protein
MLARHIIVQGDRGAQAEGVNEVSTLVVYADDVH